MCVCLCTVLSRQFVPNYIKKYDFALELHIKLNTFCIVGLLLKMEDCNAALFYIWVNIGRLCH